MAPLDFLRSRLPFGDPAPARENSDPLQQMLGRTAPAPDIQSEPPPRVHQLPYGQSGRANFYGLPEQDELNRQLIGPQGLRVFDEMYRQDPHIRRLVLMAWAPILAGTWNLEPYGGDQASDLDQEIAQTVWWALQRYMSPNLFEMLATLGPVLLRSGFCPFEQMWGTCQYQGKTYTMPRKLDLRLPRSVWRWWQDDYGELTYISQILPNRSDVIIPATELLYFRLAPEGDNWVGTSLLRHCYKPWYLKDKLERIDCIGQERKAVGVPIVYPPKGADPQTKAEFEQILANLHTSEVAYVMAPGPKAGSQGPSGVPGDEWLVEVIQFDSSSGQTIQSSLQYHQQAIESSFAMDFMALGQHQVGARATAEIQEDPYLAAVSSLVQLILPPLDRLVERIVDVNWGDKADGAPTFDVALQDTASLTELGQYLQQLVTAEVITPDPELEDWVREHASMPPANKEIRDAKMKAKMAGFEQQANPPDPLELAKAKAQGMGAPMKPGGAGGNPTRPAEQPASKTKGTEGKQLDAAAEPSAKWFERLLSQDRLREAMDGARDHIEAAVGPAALTAARKFAYQASQGASVTAAPPRELTDAFTSHYEEMYRLGHQTVTDELGRQRRALGRQLDTPTDVAAAGAASRLARARARGQHSAQNIINRVGEVLGRQQITGLKTPSLLQTLAEQTALAQLRVEALTNTAASINDGRNDAGTTASDVIGAYYTSVLDERTCSECEKSDDGSLLSPEDATALGPPNPMCAGGDFCRCALVWVLSNDPAAVAAA